LGESERKLYIEGKKAYNNAHPAAQACLSTALTISEFGLTKPLPAAISIPYDFYSGYNFVTYPTSIPGWIGN